MDLHRSHNTEPPAVGSSDDTIASLVSPIVVTCARGLAPVLAGELGESGKPASLVSETSVETRGTLTECEELNLRLRTAHRVLWLWHQFEARSEVDLYRGTLAARWEEVLRTDRPFSVRAAISGLEISDRAAALRTKDAIADRLRARLGHRPDSTSDRSGACVFVHWTPRGCRLYLDTSGMALSFRGYRRGAGAAPLRETLAAGVLLGAGWTGQAPLINPMCGSGTIAIEAAWIAARRAPGLLRRHFAFMDLRGFDPEEWAGRWQRVAAEERPVQVSIVATDFDPRAIEAARANAHAAGVAAAVHFGVAELMQTPQLRPGAWYALNPAYGVRTGGDDAAIEELHRKIGRFLRDRADGGHAVVITGNLRMARRIGLKLARRWTVYNGPIECRVLEFDLRKTRAREGTGGGFSSSMHV